MVMKKVTLGAFLLTCPWIAFSNASQQQQQRRDGTTTVDGLRAQCEAFRKDNQIKPFEIKIACGGNYTWWDSQKSSFSLGNETHMTFHTTTKDRRYETLPGESRGALARHPSVCTQYFKKEMSVPEGFSLPISLTECSEITVANIRLLCEGEVHDYCDGNFITGEELDHHSQKQGQQQQGQQQQAQQQQQSQDGMCVLRTVDSIDTCKAYN